MIREQTLRLDLHGTKPGNLPVTANVWKAKFSTVNAPSNRSSTNGINIHKTKTSHFYIPLCVQIKQTRYKHRMQLGQLGYTSWAPPPQLHIRNKMKRQKVLSKFRKKLRYMLYLLSGIAVPRYRSITLLKSTSGFHKMHQCYSDQREHQFLEGFVSLKWSIKINIEKGRRATCYQLCYIWQLRQGVCSY